MRSAALGLTLLVLGAGNLLAQETSVYFALVNTYAYTAGPRQGERHLVRTRQTLTVTGFVTDSDGVVWYSAIDPERTVRLRGTGWVALDPHELSRGDGQPVLVFPDPIDRPAQATAGLEMPSADVTLANVTKPSQTFPEVTWQKVNYETNAPALLYVRGTTGIHRPFLTEKFISDVHAEMVTQGVDSERLRRLLSGVVRVGDGPQDVRWALGEPQQQEESTAEQLKIMVWHYPGLQVRFENNVVKKIN